MRPSTEADHPAINALMCEVFGIPRDYTSIRADQLRWKYAAPRADFAGERAWIAEQGGAIVAHFGLWPLWIRTPEREIAALHGFDWTARPDAAGAGALLLKKAMQRRGAACAAGGSDDARPMFPALGFRTVQALWHWVRPVRPFKQALNRREWDAPLRLPRSLYWRYWPPVVASDWRAQSIAPEAMPDTLWPRPEPGLTVFRRNAALFRYLAACPTTPMRLYHATGARAEGYFCLARVPGVARIVDAWTASPAIEDWASLYACAFHAAAADPDVCEVVTLAGIARAQAALGRVGFRQRHPIELRVAGPVDAHGELHFQWIDNDKGFWHRGRFEYRS